MEIKEEFNPKELRVNNYHSGHHNSSIFFFPLNHRALRGKFLERNQMEGLNFQLGESAPDISWIDHWMISKGYVRRMEMYNVVLRYM